MATTASTMPRGRRRKDLSKNGEKRFICQNDGCGRSFTRAEHLQRHLLNHSTGEFTCSRCRAHFKRRDLLGKTLHLSPRHKWTGSSIDQQGHPLSHFGQYPRVDDLQCRWDFLLNCNRAHASSVGHLTDTMQTATWQDTAKKTKKLALMVKVF